MRRNLTSSNTSGKGPGSNDRQQQALRSLPLAARLLATHVDRCWPDGPLRTLLLALPALDRRPRDLLPCAADRKIPSNHLEPRKEARPMNDQLTIECGPADNFGRRLVIATCGPLDHRDHF